MKKAPSPKKEDEKSCAVDEAHGALEDVRLAVRLLQSNSVPYLELNSDECVKLADYYISQGSAVKAMCMLSEAILKDPENVEIKWKYALLNEKSYPQNAINMCGEILKIDPYHMGAMELKIELEEALNIE